jgi:hypothetical protein
VGAHGMSFDITKHEWPGEDVFLCDDEFQVSIQIHPLEYSLIFEVLL